MRRLALGLAAAAALLTAAVLDLPPAHAGTTTQAAPFGNETWYQPNPSCGTPLGCTTAAPPAVNPYGAGTLHVAASAGTETARSYLAIGTVTAPAGATLTAATLTIPLDTATTANGSSMPDTATIQVCPSRGPIGTDEGEFDAPPATTCVEGVPLTYTATPMPAFTGDISAMIPALKASLSTGTAALAILPYDASTTASWHVVFSADDRASPPTPPASLSLTYTSAGVAPPVIATSAPPLPTPPAATATPTRAPAPRGTATPSARAPARPSSTSSPVARTSTAAPRTGTPTAPPTTAAPAAVAVVPPLEVLPPVALPSVSAPPPAVASAPAQTPPASATAASSTAPAPAAPAQVQSAPTLDQAVPAAATTPDGFAYPAVLLVPFALAILGVVLARIMTGDVSRPTP